jgi:hypothetical protein
VGDDLETTVRDTTSRYARIVKVLSKEKDVTAGGESKGFGSSALKVRGRIFAMVDSTGRFVVKLPRDRVDALVESGSGVRFDPGHGRVMKEWVSLDPSNETRWLALAREAMRFVSSK